MIPSHDEHFPRPVLGAPLSLPSVWSRPSSMSLLIHNAPLAYQYVHARCQKVTLARHTSRKKRKNRSPKERQIFHFDGARSRNKAPCCEINGSEEMRGVSFDPRVRAAVFFGPQASQADAF